MTHLHLDHASAISEFTGARFVLGQGEWAAMHGPRPTFNGYIRKHVAHAVDFLEVPYDAPEVDSYSTFANSFDLFGDGSVRLVYTPGHSRGHQSLILRLRDREALIAGDAIYYLKTLENEKRGFAMADEHLWRRSLSEIQLYRRENPEALMIPGHDQATWDGLAGPVRIDGRRQTADRRPQTAVTSSVGPASDARCSPPLRRGRLCGLRTRAISRPASVNAPSSRWASGSTGCCSIRSWSMRFCTAA